MIELWQVPAEELFARGDPGLVPWIPLARFAEPVEEVFKRCREEIDRAASPDERGNLLAVTQVLARLKFNDPSLLKILGGRKLMIESPLIEEVFQEVYGERLEKEVQERVQRELQERVLNRSRTDLLRVLRGRFGEAPQDVVDRIQTLSEERLDELLEFVGACPSLEAFRERLQA